MKRSLFAAVLTTILATASVATAAAKTAAHVDYYPYAEHTYTVWENTSTEFRGVRTVSIGFMKTTKTDSGEVTQIKVKITEPDGKVSIKDLELSKDAEKVTGYDIALDRIRVEYVLPIKKGTVWTQNNTEEEITSVTESIPGLFETYQGVMKVVCRLNGGETGSGYRLYAPGVGLIEEHMDTEQGSYTVKPVFGTPVQTAKK